MKSAAALATSSIDTPNWALLIATFWIVVSKPCIWELVNPVSFLNVLAAASIFAKPATANPTNAAIPTINKVTGLINKVKAFAVLPAAAVSDCIPPIPLLKFFANDVTNTSPAALILPFKDSTGPDAKLLNNPPTTGILFKLFKIPSKLPFIVSVRSFAAASTWFIAFNLSFSAFNPSIAKSNSAFLAPLSFWFIPKYLWSTVALWSCKSKTPFIKSSWDSISLRILFIALFCLSKALFALPDLSALASISLPNPVSKDWLTFKDSSYSFCILALLSSIYYLGFFIPA